MNTALNILGSLGKKYPDRRVTKAQEKDPTRTLGLRRKWSAEMSRRFSTIKAEINKVIGQEDALGLADKEPGLQIQAERPRFEFKRDDAKFTEFGRWLDEMVEENVLEVIPGPNGMEPWTNAYVRSAYQRGLSDARNQVAKGTVLPRYDDTIGGVRSAFNQPRNADAVGLMYRRVWSDLDGVTSEMEAQMARVLAQGLAEGVSPQEMAKRLNDRVDAIGITRSRLIARTETIETYNRAALNEYQAASAMIGETVMVQWWTAEDERVRSEHRKWHGLVMTEEVGASRIGAPNCRCALLPWIESVQGENLEEG